MAEQDQPCPPPHGTGSDASVIRPEGPEARDAKRKALAEVFERVRWNRTAAARILKVSYKTLLSKLTECGLTPPKPPPTA